MLFEFSQHFIENPISDQTRLFALFMQVNEFMGAFCVII